MHLSFKSKVVISQGSAELTLPIIIIKLHSEYHKRQQFILTPTKSLCKQQLFFNPFLDRKTFVTFSYTPTLNPLLSYHKDQLMNSV